MSQAAVFHLAGAVNALLFALALGGVAHQLRTVRQRKAAGLPRGEPTAVLSLNQLSVSFWAFFAFFVYGFVIEPFNHYLVWPRLAGALMVLMVIREVSLDRRTALARLAYGLGLAALVPAVVLLGLQPSIPSVARIVPQVFALTTACFVVQSFGHQAISLRRSGRLGAVSPWMHVSSFVKDLSLLVFGLAMGSQTGWPLFVMGGASACVKTFLLWQIWQLRGTRELVGATREV